MVGVNDDDMVDMFQTCGDDDDVDVMFLPPKCLT